MSANASFDGLRMRTLLYGSGQMPFSLFLILSPSKDARPLCRAALRPLVLLIGALLSLGRAAAAPPEVVVSIKPIHSLVAAVMEGVATPALIVAGGASPHLYTLRPSDAEHLASAGIVFWIGPIFESFLAKTCARLVRTRFDQVNVNLLRAVHGFPSRSRGCCGRTTGKGGRGRLFDRWRWLHGLRLPNERSEPPSQGVSRHWQSPPGRAACSPPPPCYVDHRK